MAFITLWHILLNFKIQISSERRYTYTRYAILIMVCDYLFHIFVIAKECTNFNYSEL